MLSRNLKIATVIVLLQFQLIYYYFYIFENSVLKELVSSITSENFIFNDTPQKEKRVIKYYEWGPEGIEIDALIAFFRNVLYNYYGYTSEHHLKHLDKRQGRYEFRLLNAPKIGVIAVKKNESIPKLYLSKDVADMTRLKGARLYQYVLTEIQEALNTTLKKHCNKFHFLRIALERSSIPIIIQDSDWMHCSNNSYTFVGLNNEIRVGSVPKLCFSYRYKCGYNFPIPDYEILKIASLNWTSEQNKFEVSYPWASKLPKAIWRGSDSNEIRVNLVNLAQMNKNLIDAKLTQIKGKMNHSNMIPMEDYMKYRVILDIDGRGWTDRLPRLLCSNSVVIKIYGDHHSYFHDEVIPGIHYMSATLDNLTQVIQYAISDNHTEEIKAIIQNANKWCQNHLVLDSLRQDILEILNGYAEELFRSDSNWTNMWNHYSKDFLIGEKAWNKTGGWFDKQGQVPTRDLIVSQLPNEYCQGLTLR